MIVNFGFLDLMDYYIAFFFGWDGKREIHVLGNAP